MPSSILSTLIIYKKLLYDILYSSFKRYSHSPKSIEVLFLLLLFFWLKVDVNVIKRLSSSILIS